MTHKFSRLALCNRVRDGDNTRWHERGQGSRGQRRRGCACVLGQRAGVMEQWRAFARPTSIVAKEVQMAARVLCIVIAVFGVPVITACHPIVAATPQVLATSAILASTPESEEGAMGRSQSDIVAAAQADLAARLNVATDQIADQIKVLDVRLVTWPDASLGCPQAGMFYAQMPQQGYLILLGVGKTIYPYHSSNAGDPFLCEANAFSFPTPKVDRLVPPPDSDIN